MLCLFSKTSKTANELAKIIKIKKMLVPNKPIYTVPCHETEGA